MQETINEYGEDRYTATLTVKNPSEPIWVDFEIFEPNLMVNPPILTGYVKWDGCMEVQGGFHTCCVQDLASMQLFLVQVYRKAYTMMGSKADHDDFGFTDLDDTLGSGGESGE